MTKLKLRKRLFLVQKAMMQIQFIMLKQKWTHTLSWENLWTGRKFIIGTFSLETGSSVIFTSSGKILLTFLSPTSRYKLPVWLSRPIKRMLIRKYPALFHYIINLDLEKDLNDITKVTNNQNVALLIHLIENRANHNFQLRQDLYNLLKSKRSWG